MFCIFALKSVLSLFLISNWLHLRSEWRSFGRLFAPKMIPQTVLALRGSNGVDKGALKPLPRPWRCRAAFFLVKYSTWWHLPSKTHNKIDKLKELLHLAWEVFNFLGSSLASGLARTPGWPWPRGTKAEMGQGSIWVQKWWKSESSQNGILYSGKS